MKKAEKKPSTKTLKPIKFHKEAFKMGNKKEKKN